MTLQEQAVYSIGLIALLLLGYIFRSPHFGKYIGNKPFFIQWHYRSAREEKQIEDYENSIFSTTSSTAHQLSPGWWTNETNFQLERRAVFSKASSFVQLSRE